MSAFWSHLYIFNTEITPTKMKILAYLYEFISLKFFFQKWLLYNIQL